MKLSYFTVVLLIYSCLNQGTNALTYKKEGESLWKEIETFPFEGNRLESQNFSALILPNSIIFEEEDNSIFSCKYINQSFEVFFFFFLFVEKFISSCIFAFFFGFNS